MIVLATDTKRFVVMRGNDIHVYRDNAITVDEFLSRHDDKGKESN